jgi:hypothetical protein
MMYMIMPDIPVGNNEYSTSLNVIIEILRSAISAPPIGLVIASGVNKPKNTRSLNVAARFEASPLCPVRLSTLAFNAETQAVRLFIFSAGCGMAGV